MPLTGSSNSDRLSPSRTGGPLFFFAPGRKMRPYTPRYLIGMRAYAYGFPTRVLLGNPYSYARIACGRRGRTPLPFLYADRGVRKLYSLSCQAPRCLLGNQETIT